MAGREVHIIPATKERYTQAPINDEHKRKVAAYARVSTDFEEQQTSFDAQVDYYTNYIKDHDGWEFVGVYTDDGISATSTKHREGFNRMISDALAGKIDLIITKSVSRFARNTVDSLQNIRNLKKHGVECYFEKENIRTFDDKGELLITIMSSLAQEESRSISQNCTWGQRKRFADGKVSVAYSRFLGYDKGEDGEWVINEEQAKVVRKIYRLFLEGLSYNAIAKRLTEQGIETPGHKKNWAPLTVKGILTNEKYKGDAMLQKNYTVDFLTKKMKKNEGELKRYYLTDHHPAIITKETFDLVQAEIERRSGKGRYSGVSIFSSKIRCADCGEYFVPRVWHSNDPYRKVIWQCGYKYKVKGKPCRTPHFSEEEIKERFVKAMNDYAKEKSGRIDDLKEMVKIVSDTSELEKKKQQAADEVNATAGLIQRAVEENARKPLDQTEYRKRYDELVTRYEMAEAELNGLRNQISSKKARATELRKLIRETEKLGEVYEFDAGMWGVFVDEVIVEQDGKMWFKMKDWRIIEV